MDMYEYAVIYYNKDERMVFTTYASDEKEAVHKTREQVKENHKEYGLTLSQAERLDLFDTYLT